MRLLDKKEKRIGCYLRFFGVSLGFLLFASCSDSLDTVQLGSNASYVFNNNEIKSETILLDQTRDCILDTYYERLWILDYIDSWLSDIKDDGSWSDINYNNNEGEYIWEPVYHISRIRYLAYVYWLHEEYHTDRTVNVINRALGFWKNNNFVCSNWWYNTIGACTVMGEILTLMKGNVSEDNWSYMLDYINKDIPTGFCQGSNKIDEAWYKYLRGLCLDDADIINKNVGSIYEEIKYSEHDGVQVDGSYLASDKRYIAGYGETYFSGIIKLAMCTRGTDYKLPDEKIEFLRNYFLNTYTKCMRGKYLDYAATGRCIARYDFLDRSSTISPILKYLKEIDLSHKSDYEKSQSNIEGTSSSYSEYCNYYFRSDYLLKCNDRYTISVGGTSNRLGKPERGNGENLKGSLLSLGTTTFRVNGDEYYNIFPCWDWSKIPGVTSSDVVPDFEKDWSVFGKNEYSGGLSNGKYGSYAFKLDDYNLSAIKGYYLVEGGIVCIGNSLNSAIGEELHTAIDQCIYKGNYNVAYNSNGEAVSVCHNNVWYYLLSNNKIDVSANDVTGNWNTINTEEVFTDDVTIPVFSISINDNETNDYAYVVIPNPIYESDVKETVENIEILQNNKELQVVLDKKSDLLYISFFEAGRFNYGNNEISTDTPCMLMVEGFSKGLNSFYISDPTQSNSSIILKVNNTIKTISLPSGSYAGSSARVELEDGTTSIRPVTM